MGAPLLPSSHRQSLSSQSSSHVLGSSCAGISGEVIWQRSKSFSGSREAGEAVPLPPLHSLLDREGWCEAAGYWLAYKLLLPQLEAWRLRCPMGSLSLRWPPARLPPTPWTAASCKSCGHLASLPGLHLSLSRAIWHRVVCRGSPEAGEGGGESK